MAGGVTPSREYTLEFTNLCGGINLRDPDYRMKANESPEMQNLLWRDGMLRSRFGQSRLSSEEPGTGYAAYEHLWHEHIFCHIGTSLYAFPYEPSPDGEGGPPEAVDEVDRSITEETSEVEPVLLCSGIPEVRGTFFLYSNALYYKTRGAYKVITAEYADGGWSFTASSVVPYVPVVLINADPSTGAGDLYQPENRLEARKTVWYNAQTGVTQYKLPVMATTVTRVEVNGTRLSSGWSYYPQTGMVQFTTAPPVTNPPTNNTVRITYLLENAEAYQSISDCRYAAVYGGTGELCVVMAGSLEQPNAYFWSGNSDIKMDAGYFPIEQYQLASSTEERITGFGKQQDNLIVFKENSVGKTTINTAVLNDRVYIDMPYIPINAGIGCSFPWSIQLVENNLVFASRSGVYMLLDTTAANENNIFCISRKIDKAFARNQFTAVAREGSACHATAALSELEGGEESSTVGADEDTVCSCDDGHRYSLTGGGVTWCWDYDISSYKDPSWFYLTNINAIAWITRSDQGIAPYAHLDQTGRITELQEAFNDYGEAIEKIYRFPMMNFSGYDTRKNVNSVLLTLGAYERESTELVYITDYEERADLTNLEVVPDYEASRIVGTRPQNAIVPAVFRRRPMCRRILHFTMRLTNNNVNEDLELIGARVFFVTQGRLR